mgnify:CR=1 FL=1
MKRILLAALCLLTLSTQAQYRSEVWCPDRGDGTYQNPVLNADYSDPDVCAVGDDYYLTASSFNCIPGLPILHSKDLVNWTIIGHALQEQLPADVFAEPQHGKGVWAPSIRHHDGWFYIYWGDPDLGVMMVKAQDPAGPWSKPLCVIAGKGMIDTCPLWDDDGRCYLVNGWAGSRAGFNSVLTVRELSADGTQAIGRPAIVFDGGEVNHTTEGPKFYKREGYYWIMCPAGGVAMGWQLAMRSRSPYGPYEWQRVMEQGRSGINGPHQGAWVHTPYDEDWFLHFHDKDAYGRVVYLQPVDWSTGWPMMGKAASGTDGKTLWEPVMRYQKPRSAATTVCNPQESDEFDSPQLGLQWQWHANYNQLWGMPTTDGTLRLYTADVPADYRSLWQVPNLLLQKTPADTFTATTKLRFASKEDDQLGGLVMMGRSYASLVVRRMGDTFLLQRLDCDGADEGGQETATTLATLQPTQRDTIPYSPAIYLDIYLRLKVDNGQCRFYYSQDGRRYHEAGPSFTMRPGKWIGAKMGYVALCRNRQSNRGWIDADWFRVTTNY